MTKIVAGVLQVVGVVLFVAMLAQSVGMAWAQGFTAVVLFLAGVWLEYGKRRSG